MLRGRQIAWYIYHHFRLSEAEGCILELNDLVKVELKGDNLVSFQNDWNAVLTHMKKRPEPEELESLFRTQLEKSVEFKDTLALYEMRITQDGIPRSYDALTAMLHAHLEHRRTKKTREELESKSRGPGGLAGTRATSPKTSPGECR